MVVREPFNIVRGGEGTLQQINVQETIERVVETPVGAQPIQGLELLKLSDQPSVQHSG